MAHRRRITGHHSIKMRITAIIPARGGSKRIPKKNIKTFAGKPMIAYAIEAAKETELFDRIIVSTDAKDIADVALAYGAEVPFIRPESLSDDFTGTVPVLVHALSILKEQGFSADYFCCLYATAPFLRGDYIKQGLTLLRENSVTTVFSVTSFPSPVFRALTLKENGHIEMVWPEYYHTRSQDLVEAYHDAGQFYWADTEKFLKEQMLFSKDSMPVILPRAMVQDIDTPEDWEMAEKMYQLLHMRK